MEPDVGPYPLKNSPQYKKVIMNNPNTEFKKQKFKHVFFKSPVTSSGTVHSSNGDIKIELDTGKIKKIHSTSIGFIEWAKEIKRFDLEEYRHAYDDLEGKDTSFDIMDLGFWRNSGKYVPPSKSFRI